MMNTITLVTIIRLNAHEYFHVNVFCESFSDSIYIYSMSDNNVTVTASAQNLVFFCSGHSVKLYSYFINNSKNNGINIFKFVYI